MYDRVDHSIRNWASAHSFVLFDSFAGEEARFCYVSSVRGECLQISVDRPEANDVTVRVFDVETVEDQEIRMEWTTDVSKFRETLEIALSEARRWLKRD